MYCSNCGLPLKEEETICPSCQTPIDSGIKAEIVNDANNDYENFKETERLSEQYGFSKLLIFAILEFISCSSLFGIIALILTLTKLKNAIEQRQFEEADKAKNLVKTILIIGVVWGVLSKIVFQALMMLGEIF